MIIENNACGQSEVAKNLIFFLPTSPWGHLVIKDYFAHEILLCCHSEKNSQEQQGRGFLNSEESEGSWWDGGRHSFFLYEDHGLSI